VNCITSILLQFIVKPSGNKYSSTVHIDETTENLNHRSQH